MGKALRSSKTFSAIVALALAAALFPSVSWADAHEVQGAGTRPLFTTALADTPADGDTLTVGQSADYATLAEAIAAVPAGISVTIWLVSDTNETTPVTAKANTSIDIDLAGHTVNVSLGSTSRTFITAPSSAKLALHDGTFAGNRDGRALSVSGELSTQDLIVDNFTSSEDGGALYLSGKATCVNTTFSNNTSEKKAVDRYGGGAIYLPQSPSGNPYEINLDGCTLSNNFAAGTGGAICLDWSGTGTIRNTTFTNNESYVSGGAIYANFPGDLLFEGNTFDGNKATKAYSYDEYYRTYSGVVESRPANANALTRIGYGGAMRLNCLNHSTYTSYGIGPSKVTLRDNRIVGNVATERGGGISLVNNQFGAKANCVFIESGLFEGNSADAGGAIDYTQHRQAALQLNDALITGNSAVRGGGVWLCPQGSIDTYSTLGGTITGNQANGQMRAWNISDGIVLANGDDVNHEGSDSKDVQQIADEPANGAKVTNRGLGGVGIDWYEDEADHDTDGNHVIERFREGHRVLVFPAAAAGEYPDLVNGTDLSFGIHAELASGNLSEQERYAKIIIRGNEARRGGGIAANSPVVMGVDEPTKTVSVSKRWASDEPHPALVLVDLYRIDNGDEANAVKLDSGVELNEGNHWAATFDNLPAYGLDDSGNQVDYTYTVREQPVEGWEEDVDAREETTTGLETVIVITNKSKPVPTEPVDVVLVKHLQDALIHSEEFSFGLYGADDQLLDTVHTTLGTHKSDGYSSLVEIAFKDLVFEEAGTYTYTIREHMDGTTEVVEGDENNLAGFEPGFYKGGVKYDDKEYRAVVTVTDEDGQLVATVSYPDNDGNDNAELYNYYDEEFTEIDGQDSHPNDGKHEDETSKEDPVEPEQKETPKKQPATPKATPKASSKVATPAKGTARTADAAPLASLALLVAAGGASALSRRRAE